MTIKGKISKVLNLILPGLSYEEKIFSKESRKLAFATYPENFGRALVLIEFIDMCKSKFDKREKLNVALIGGYESEPEIKVLNLLNITFELNIYGIEEGMRYFDLNVENKRNPNLNDHYDLILCSQVWEHIWNHNQAMTNIYDLMSIDTILWLACPTSNRPHSSPNYYTAGFTLEYLQLNLQLHNFVILGGGQLGTRRNYIATHTIPKWLSVKGHLFPPIWAFSDKNFIKRSFLSLRYFLRNFDLLFFSRKVTSDVRCATETWVCAMREDSIRE